MNTNKPINQDSDFNTMEVGAAVTAWNTILSEDKKNRCNERGFVPIDHIVDNTKTTILIGVIELPDGQICFYVDETDTYSYVIWLQEYEYHTYLRKKVLVYRDVNLKFNQIRPIKGEFTYNYNKDLIIVFIEGVESNANKPRYLNCTKILSKGFDINEVELTLPIDGIDFVRHDMGAGRLPIGVYTLKLKYVDSDGLETNGTNLSNTYSVVKIGSSGITVQGGVESAYSNQTIVLSFVDLNTSFDKFKVYIVHNNGTTDSFYCSDVISYVGSVIKYSLSSLSGLNNSSYEAMFKDSIAINKASAIAKMNNSLLLGNTEVINLGTILSSSHHNLTTASNGTGIAGKATIAALGQAIANDVVVNYDINTNSHVFDVLIDGGHNKTFMPDEVYALYLTLRLKTGGILGSWHIPGRPSWGGDKSDNWDLGSLRPAYKVTGTSSADYTQVPYVQYTGAMGYWENTNEVYPSNFPSAHTTVTQGEHYMIKHDKSTTNVILAGAKVRHHRMPASKHWSFNIRIALQISNVLIPVELQPYIGAFEIHYAKRNMTNSLLVCQGMYSSISQYSRRFHSFDALFHKMDLSNVSIVKQLKEYNDVVVNGTNMSKLGAVEYFPGYGFSDPDYGDWTESTASWETNRDSIFINELLEIPDENGILPFVRTPKNLKFREQNDSSNNRFQESHYTMIFRDGNTGSTDYVNNGAGNDGTPRLVALFNDLDDCYSTYQNQELCLAGSYNIVPTVDNQSANPYFYFTHGDGILADYYYRINYAHNQKTQDEGSFSDNCYVNEAVGRHSHVWYETYLMHVSHYSTCNTQLRHEGINKNETFYPVCSIETWFKMGALADNWINTATGKAYNKAFSKLNDYEQPLIVDFAAKYSNLLPYRICVSNPNRTESLQFNWRKFDTEYFDVNYDKGQIMGLFATPNKLYIQQEYALFVTTLNDTLKTDSGSGLQIQASTLLGRTPIEIIDDNIGAIGCTHRFSNKLTKAGYIAIDVKKHKIFVVRDTIIPLSDLGLKNFYINNLQDQNDNPYTQDGVHVIDDIIENDRILICDNSATGFTISYDTKLWQPISFHNYKPVITGRSRQGLYAYANNDLHGMYQMNRGDYGKYIRTVSTNDVVYPMWIDLQLNPQFQVEKLLRSVNWITHVTNPNGVIDYTKTFNLILVYNDTQCTGYRLIIPQDCWYNHEFGKLAQGNWFYNNISDLIRDNTLPLGLSLRDWQLNSDNLLQSPEFFVNSDIIGNYCIIRLLYNNMDNCKLQFNDFSANLYKVTR